MAPHFAERIACTLLRVGFFSFGLTPNTYGVFVNVNNNLFEELKSYLNFFKLRVLFNHLAIRFTLLFIRLIISKKQGLIVSHSLYFSPMNF